MTNTLPKALLHNARVHARRPAYRLKDLGIWRTWTWGEVADEVRALSVGLQALGLKRGQTLAIVSDNRPRAYWTMAAAQSLGAIPVPLYQDAVADEIAWVAHHSEAVIALVQNQEQADKLISIRRETPNLHTLVYDEPRGMRHYDPARIKSYDAVVQSGRSALEADPKLPERWFAEVQAGEGGDPSVILYTSGTTGRPKGVVLTHDNVLITARNANAFDKLTEREEMIAYLPMAWVGDHLFSYGQAIAAGFCVACPESGQTVIEDRREIGPTNFFAPPRVYENLLTQIMVRMEDAGWSKRQLFRSFMGMANRHGERILNGERVPLIGRAMYALGRAFVYGPIKNRLGFSRIRTAYTAGEAIGPEIFRFYRALGLNLKQLYGQTEACVYVTMQADGAVGADDVGQAAPEVRLRLSETGEVEYASPGAFAGYFKNEAATAETKTADGWVKTGDAGLIDGGGTLRIIDRAKDVGRLRDGSLLPPKYLENKLKFYPNIKEAVVFGDGRAYAAAFINIDPLAVGNWAERNNVTYASYQELAEHPRVAAMIAGHVDEVNASLAKEPRLAGARIARFLILHKELDADDGELTRTQKVKRSFIADRYAPLVEALYDGSETRHVATEVTFEDGRRGVLEATVRIYDAASADPKPSPAAGTAPRLEAAE
jgi:long-chain acyl-CoA synthetase